MIAATATFAVFKRQSSPTTIQVVTILTGLTDIRPHDAIAPALPTYDEAVPHCDGAGFGTGATDRIPQTIRRGRVRARVRAHCVGNGRRTGFSCDRNDLNEPTQTGGVIWRNQRTTRAKLRR